MSNNKFQGKRAELGIYDDAWIHGDDAVEYIVTSPDLLHDKITSERHMKFQIMIDEFLKQLPLDKLEEIVNSKLNNSELTEE